MGKPLRRWILCDVNPDEVSAVYPNNDECIEEVEADRRDDEKSMAGNIWSMIEEGETPWPSGASLDHILGVVTKVHMAGTKYGKPYCFVFFCHSRLAVKARCGQPCVALG